jgi:hypothetical protein
VVKNLFATRDITPIKLIRNIRFVIIVPIVVLTRDLRQKAKVKGVIFINVFYYETISRLLLLFYITKRESDHEKYHGRSLILG